MESAGLAIGVAGLAGLFSACVDSFEYIQLGRQFGNDYGKCLLKLDAARLQLSRWGAATGLNAADSSLQKQPVASSPIQEMQLAQNLLWQILDSFEDAENISARYRGRVSAVGTTVASTALADAYTADISPDYQRVHLHLKEIAQQRQKSVSVRKKARWALYERKKFDRMIENVVGFINTLVNLFPSTQNTQQELCKTEIDALASNPKDLALLEDVVGRSDEILSGEIKRQMQSRGHVYTDFKATEGKLWGGDENEFGVESKVHQYARFSVSGTADVHLGNVNRGMYSRR